MKEYTTHRILVIARIRYYKGKIRMEGTLGNRKRKAGHKAHPW